MKTTKKPGHLPTLSSSQTPREQHRPLSYYFKDELASLSEFEEHTKKLKTLPTERKHQEASPTLPNFFKNSNPSLTLFSKILQGIIHLQIQFHIFPRHQHI